ncbi:hypothetical protein SLE2022_069470 [Rubroshorea leprosula]
MEREKSSSKRSRDDRDCDSTEDHRDHKHHRSHRDSDRNHGRSDYKSPRRDGRETSRDREKSCDSRDEREGSRDRRERSPVLRIEREGSFDRESKRGSREGVESRDKTKHRELKREGSYEEMESEGRKKRKEREDGQERVDKRARVSSEGRKERRKFEDGAKEGDGKRDERRERKRFEDKVKEEVEDGKEVPANYSETKVKEEVKEGFTDATAAKGGEPVENGAYHESSILKVAPKKAENSKASDHPLTTKVSITSSPNENKGVSITRSHEVIGTASTDATSAAAGRSGGNLSLDALAKAKKALQMQKELAEKLKKIPTLNKGGSSSSGAAAGVVQGRTVPSAISPTAVRTTLGSTSSSSALLEATPASVKPPPSGGAAVPGLAAIPNLEAVKRAQELAAKMGFRQDPQFAPLINLFPGQLPTDVSAAQKPTKAPVLRVDALGREIDEHGNVINVTKPSNLSTLKVNINKQKKEAFQILKPELDVDPESNPHFDARMGINKNKLLRPKRMTFQFVEEGKWAKEAEIIKLKSQFGEAGAKELKAKQAQLAKVKADINPNLIEVSERVVIKEKPKDPIPEVEWWDLPLLATGSYGDVASGEVTEDKLKIDKITIYVEHPLPIEPPAESAPPPPQPLKLTKKEQKKLRTQRRLAREKDRQEMIRQGLIEPPKPKVKLSNLMKVLGSEATQDPTKLEMEIRTAAAEREQAHVDRNIARKLTPAERREKKERKLFDDPNTLEAIVSVYKINNLSHPKTRFKVDVNAQENRLTGCAVISDGMSVVAVEGASKSIKRYGKLMLRRISWAEAVKEEDEDEDGNQDKPINKCMLVWQGSVAKPSFHKFSVHECMTEAAARKVFSDAGVAHYWDLAVNFTED